MFRHVRAPGVGIALALLALTVIFYWKILFTSQAIFPWDLMDFHYPLLAYVHEEIRHFRLPLWLPYAFSGFPIIADPEGQIFYPPNWLMVLVHPFAPLPFRLVEIQIVVHYFLAGLFMFHLARDFTRDTLSALFGGILFMFSGAMVAHAQHLAIINANAWFPLVFLLARRGLLENQRFYTLAAGVFFGIEILTGHVQHAVLLGLLLFLYFAYEACVGPDRARLWPRWMWQLALIAAIGAGLGMVQISCRPPSSARFPSVLKSHTGTSTQGNHPTYLWTLFLPNYFGGINGVPYLRSVEPSFHYVFLTVPGCLLALVGLIEMARRRNFFWLGLILVCSILAMGKTGYLDRDSSTAFRFSTCSGTRPCISIWPTSASVLWQPWGCEHYGIKPTRNTTGNVSSSGVDNTLVVGNPAWGRHFSLRRAFRAGITCSWFLRHFYRLGRWHVSRPAPGSPFSIRR